MQPPLPAPSAQGAFAKTPFPHVLVYALERALSGTFELHLGGGSVATILVVQGCPAKVRLTDGLHFLGNVMLDMGLLTPEQHGAAIQYVQQSPRLFGQALLEMGLTDPPRLEAALRAQVERKLEHLFTLPPDAVFSYFDGVDTLQHFGGPPTQVDPLPVLWRGIRQSPAWEHVDGTLRRVGSMQLRVPPNAQIDRFQLGRGEVAAIELLRQRPMRMVDLANAKVIGPSVAQLLVYCLVITKQLEMVETPSMRPAGAPGATPSSRSNVPAAPPSSSQSVAGQAFARVQLQAKQVSRNPLIVEEVASGAVSRDERNATPAPHAQETVPGADLGASPAMSPPAMPGGMPDAGDIASMIMATIGASGAPPPMVVPTPFAPPAPISSRPGGPPAPASSGGLPAAPESGPGGALTAEQNALKQKILEKAAQITGQNYFQMLGLEQDASTETVQKTFFTLAKVWHPDRLPNALHDVKDACSKVFTHLTEAHATLMDPARRAEYMTLLKDGGATPDDQRKIQAIIEAAQDFQKAEFHLKRNEIDKALELARKAHAADDEQGDYLAMITWIEAQAPQWLSREKTLEKVAILDRCLGKNPNSERALFWRGMLYRRIEENAKAMKDLKRVIEMNPRNLDAAREVRLYNIRGGSKAPPATGGRTSGKPPPASDSLGGLFGKLFKK